MKTAIKDKYKLIFNIIDYVSIGLLIVFWVVGLYLILFKKSIFWVDIIRDDAYYYLGIIRNLVEGNGSVFLPPFATNGYQPLWLLLLWVSATIFGISDQSLVIQIYTLSCLLVLIFAIASKYRYGYCFPAIFSSLLYNKIMLIGMETALLPILFILFVDSSNWKKRGIFASAIFLARLDALSIIIARDIYRYLIKEKSDFKYYLILIPVILLYLATNYLLFGVPIPVSGLAKSIGNIYGENIYIIFGYLDSLPKVIKLLCVVVLLMLINKKGIDFSFRKELSILAIALMICATYYTIFSGWRIWSWYYWPTFLILYYLSLELVKFANKSALENSVAINIISVIIIVITFNYIFRPVIGTINQKISLLDASEKSLRYTVGRKNLELIDYLKSKNIKEGSFFAMGDRAGSFGFFLGNKFNFIHTEGIVGPYSYYKAMIKDKGKEYLDSLPINYYVVDREKYIEHGSVIGVIEPIQGYSSHAGPFLICFNKSSAVFDQSYENSHMYVFDYQSQIICPSIIEERFIDLKSKYTGVNQFSLPSEWRGKGGALN